MTLLNWEMTPDYVLLLSDTLTLDGADFRARGFTTKILPAPHIGAVITGTGIAPVVNRFYFQVLENLFVDDVEHLTEFAPDILRELWKEMESQLWDGASVTIYTFGLAEESGQFAGYAYRSTADFEPHRLQHGLALKPAIVLEGLPAIDSLAAFVEVAKKQQIADRDKPRLQRVGIGGELWLYLLKKAPIGSLSLQVDRLERLPYYEQDRDMSLAKLNPTHPGSHVILARDR